MESKKLQEEENEGNDKIMDEAEDREKEIRKRKNQKLERRVIKSVNFNLY